MAEMPLYKKIVLILAAIALFGFVISGIRLFERSRDAQKVGQATAEPEAFTLAKLIDRGPDGNAHVRVTDLVLDSRYLARTSKIRGGDENIKHIWAVARLPGEAADGPIRVLVKNTSVSSRSDADAFLSSRSVQGLVINKIDRPSDDEVKLLRGSYPGFDPDKVILIEVNREPPGQLASFNGIFCLIAGLVVVVCLVVAFWDSIPGLAPRPRKRRRRRTFDYDVD